jgi:hypothetical protein
MPSRVMRGLFRRCVEQLLERQAVVDVGAGQDEGERNVAAVGDEVAFGAGPASVGRVRAGGVTPFLAAMDELSTQARLQSIRTPSPQPASPTGCPCEEPTGCLVSAARAGTAERSPFDFAAGGGSSGSMINQSTSDTRAATIPLHDSPGA